MKKTFFAGVLTLVFFCSDAQDIARKIQSGYQEFENDTQLKHATSSLYVINARTGEIVFDKNSQVGLAPASTQKIITSSTAFELLGKDYQYKTEFGILSVNGSRSLYIRASGDPTLGSWRWESTKEQQVLGRLGKAIKENNLKSGQPVSILAAGWLSERTPDGWIWQDIGNYYGAGAGAFNWRENQYDLFLRSGSQIGDTVAVAGTEPYLYAMLPGSLAVSAASGSGDNAYIYTGGSRPVVRGTIPVNEQRFRISGSMSDPENEFVQTLVNQFKDNFKYLKAVSVILTGDSASGKLQVIHTETSPRLDSIVYWFNKKSINLYGEALIKTMAYVKEGTGSTEKGVRLIKEFWKQKGIDEGELNIRDGSGLSPLNRVTTHAQVAILKYATTRDWYPSFYDALPEYNGMKMKSGTISGAKGFCGYQKSKDGTEYIFSFLVNNYNGPASSLVAKMYKVLDNLK